MIDAAELAAHARSPSPSRGTASRRPSTDPTQLAEAVDGSSARAPGRSPSTPSAHRATATASAPTWCSCAARASGTRADRPASPLPDLSALGEAIADDEWVLHAATQDLPCLAEIGLRPGAGCSTPSWPAGCSGYARVGLGAIVEEVLGFTLEKGHSAADWSTRPLPEPWLRYAALDVEVLVELRDALAAELDEQGKRDWAAPGVRGDRRRARRRRRASTRGGARPGLHRLRKRRQLAVVRALWEARDEMARRRDIAPGRVLPDAAMVAAALALPTHRAPSCSRCRSSAAARSGSSGADLVRRPWPRPCDLPEADLPQLKAAGRRARRRPRSWADRDPAAAARLAAARAAVAAIADEHRCRSRTCSRPTPCAGSCWEPPAEPDADRRGGRRAARPRRPRVAGRRSPPPSCPGPWTGPPSTPRSTRHAAAAALAPMAREGIARRLTILTGRRVDDLLRHWLGAAGAASLGLRRNSQVTIPT